MSRIKWIKLLFALYCGVMLWLLFGQRIGDIRCDDYWQCVQDKLIYTPLETIRRFIWVLRYSSNQAQIRHAVVNLVGNVVMFVPLGFFMPCLWAKARKFWWHLLYMSLTIIAVELVQLFALLGTCDVDDLLLNLVGTTLGFLAWKCVEAWALPANG